MSTTVTVYTAEQVAQLLNCAVKTVEQMAREGRLAGMKPGGSWVFPAGALAQRLDQLALEQASELRKPAKPDATTPADPFATIKARRGPKVRTLPVLVDMGAR